MFDLCIGSHADIRQFRGSSLPEVSCPTEFAATMLDTGPLVSDNCPAAKDAGIARTESPGRLRSAGLRPHSLKPRACTSVDSAIETQRGEADDGPPGQEAEERDARAGE